MIVKIGLLARLAGMEVIDFGNFSNPITHVRRPVQPRGAGPSQLALSLSLSALFRCCFKQIAQNFLRSKSPRVSEGA